jgi:3-oxoacyl-[acyl-carrier protein] reductase
LIAPEGAILCNDIYFNSLKQSVALVTGAARGIGAEIALRLAGHGAKVAVVDVQLEAARQTAESAKALGVEAQAYECDVSSFEAVKALAESVSSDLGGVDILVNNAGITRDRLIMRMTPEDWNAVLSVNLTGAFNFCKVFGPQMIKKRAGSIVNIASVIGLSGNAGQANYAASKAGVIGLTKSLAKEFGSRGVRVNAIAPGFIETAMTESLAEDIQKQMKTAIPLGKFGKPGDIANVVVFLVSELGSYVTGQVINCDGGMVTAR